MKKAVIICLIISSVSHAALSPLQCAKGTYAAASSCTVTLLATKAGSLLVGSIGLNSVTLTNVTGVSDSANTYTHATGADATGTTKATEIWYKCNSTAGGTTVTFSLATPLTGDCFVCEFPTFANSSCLDTTNAVNSGTTADPENGTALTPTYATAVLVVALMPETTVTSVASPWTGQFGTNKVSAAYLVPGSVSAQTPAFSGDSHIASNYCSSGASFTPANITLNLMGNGLEK